jgi:RNA polymerase sigma-70 factor (ECF subfamily)
MDTQALQDQIEQARRGDPGAFAALVRCHQDYAYGVAFRLLWDVQEAEDTVQEAFVRIWQHLPAFDRTRRFTTWMYAIVANLCRDRLRERRRRPALTMEPAELERLQSALEDSSGMGDDEIHTILRLLCERLPLKQRMVFTLRDLQDLSVEEVASVLEMSAGSVKTNLHLARRKLRRLLALEYNITGVES